MSAPDLGFVHRFVPGSGDARLPALLLLHGTGGNEDDLIPFGQMLLPGAPLLSPRGKVLENGMPRFFRRLAEGVFDLDDLIARAAELAEFVRDARERYGITDRRLFAAGFSNGANIAAALLLVHPGTLDGALLFRPMVPLEPQRLPDLSGVPVFIAAGEADPLVPAAETQRLAALLERAGAEVSTVMQPGGHGLTRGDILAARAWLARVLP